MGLSKQADGLPRFMMDCGWWRNGKKWRRRTLAEMGLHQAGVSHANEHGTDGVLPGPASELAESLSLPAKEVARVLPLLISRGVWKQRDDGDLEVVDFLDHNPSRAEVAADRRRRQLASIQANHQRHHVKKGMSDPDCPFCSDSDSDGDSESHSDPESQADSNNGSKGSISTDGTEQSSSSSVVPPRLAAVPKDDDDDGLDPFWRFWAKTDLKAYKRECSVPIRSEVGFLERAAQRRREWHEDEVRVYLAEHPTSPFPEVIDAVTHVDRATRATAVPLCGECSNGWIESAAGVVRCECRRAS